MNLMRRLRLSSLPKKDQIFQLMLSSLLKLGAIIHLWFSKQEDALIQFQKVLVVKKEKTKSSQSYKKVIPL
jgi:hypothetical protein